MKNYFLMKGVPGLKIFIVDEDHFCLNMYQQYLLNLGYGDTQIFSSPGECLAKLELRPDLVFVDHEMEAMNALEVLKVIKNHNPDIYVIMVSGNDDKQAAYTAQKCGAFDYIVKGEHEEKNIAMVLHKINTITAYLSRRTV